MDSFVCACEPSHILSHKVHVQLKYSLGVDNGTSYLWEKWNDRILFYIVFRLRQFCRQQNCTLMWQRMLFHSKVILQKKHSRTPEHILGTHEQDKQKHFQLNRCHWFNQSWPCLRLYAELLECILCRSKDMFNNVFRGQRIDMNYSFHYTAFDSGFCTNRESNLFVKGIKARSL